jgi:addiction module HigA family antidote
MAMLLRWKLLITTDNRKDSAMAKLDLIHPGEILFEEFMQPLGVSQNRLSRDLNVPVNRINDIVHGRRGITADTALRLAKFFGTTPDFWLGLQVEYDLRRAERETWPKEKDNVRTFKAA